MNAGEKVAIVADIHGNSAALKAVLDDIDKDEQIKHIYCLGDLIGIGHETNEVLELLFSRNDISFVMGNHDEAVLKILDGNEPGSVGDEREHHKWIASGLDEKLISRLKSIPMRQNARINGENFLFIHYHLNAQDEFLPIDNQPTSKRLDDIYELTDADVICFGHHHTVHHFKSKERLYLNPSSLGCTPKPLAPYAKLQVGEFGQINVSFIEVSYDNKEFLLGYEKLNVPAGDDILKNFHGNQHLNISK
ncbi:metallophosphoesterase family protein [Virgibacillus sp. L01]|uniref:metallophosphoesterase family protein n=1 Tax=Virgibacillus sp. L01 TaxID=3457429 RepID=UPI003FD47329